jgi:hypothetical protein
MKIFGFCCLRVTIPSDVIIPAHFVASHSSKTENITAYAAYGSNELHLSVRHKVTVM